MVHDGQNPTPLRPSGGTRRGWCCPPPSRIDAIVLVGVSGPERRRTGSLNVDEGPDRSFRDELQHQGVGHLGRANASVTLGRCLGPMLFVLFAVIGRIKHVYGFSNGTEVV
jgi:hypothetical protein